MVERSLARLAGAMSRRRRAVVAGWLVVLAAGAWFSLHQSDHLSGGGWEVPGSPSVRVVDALRRFPNPTRVQSTFLVVVTDPNGPRDRLQEVRLLAERDPQVHSGMPIVLDGGVAILPLAYTGKTSTAIDEASRLRHLLVDRRTRVIGEAAIWSNFQDVSKRQLARGEALGFPLILLILLAGFGTLVAALAPLALGAVAVFLSGAVIYLLSRSTVVSVYVTNMASMIGIGVAVDYSLFIVSRFRRELHDPASAPAEPDGALRRAMASSGTAVLFSGATVAVSLAALFVIDVNALRSMALGAIVVVCISVLASMTLLPALLAAAGTRIDRLRLPLPWRTTEAGSDAFWGGWARRVMRRPLAGFIAGAGVMLVLALPFLSMQTFNRGLDELPANAEVRVATERVQKLAGPGFGEPVRVLTTDDGPALAAKVARVPGVAHVAPPLHNPATGRWLVDATLAMPSESSAAQAVVERIRSLAGSGAVVGGSTVFDMDVTHAMFGGIWKMLLVILAASYIVLFLLLRSVVLPLKAVVMNLLSVGAAYGVLVAVFQWGWLDWTGYHSPGYVNTIVPALVLAVTFGLSMDYEVFLLTRIRERWLVHHDNERAVAEGLTQSARIITSAALVMVAVFFAFAVAGAPSLKELGVGLGVAILLDATIVRLLVVPSAMRLLGRWNWWMPAPLARLLPAPSH
jgi:uncharacterized membrane protein YdfJ with MMPL/SSD domain